MSQKPPKTSPVRDLREFYPEELKVVSHKEHKHDWYFAKDYLDHGKPVSKFVCICGGVIRVEQFPVED